jgi:hypothetical protein
VDFWAEGVSQILRVQLEDIVRAVSLDEPAAWPRQHEPTLVPRIIGFQFGDAAAHGGCTLIVLRLTEDAFVKLGNKQIGKLWTVDRTEEDGSTIVHFRADADMPLYFFLRDSHGVTILRPTMWWKFALLDGKAAVKKYEEVAKLIGQYRIDEDHEYKIANPDEEDGPSLARRAQAQSG